MKSFRTITLILLTSLLMTVFAPAALALEAP